MPRFGGSKGKKSATEYFTDVYLSSYSEHRVRIGNRARFFSLTIFAKICLSSSLVAGVHQISSPLPIFGNDKIWE
jgi:hypothetical protein